MTLASYYAVCLFVSEPPCSTQLTESRMTKSPISRRTASRRRMLTRGQATGRGQIVGRRQDAQASRLSCRRLSDVVGHDRLELGGDPERGCDVDRIECPKAWATDAAATRAMSSSSSTNDTCPRTAVGSASGSCRATALVTSTCATRLEYSSRPEAAAPIAPLSSSRMTSFTSADESRYRPFSADRSVAPRAAPRSRSVVQASRGRAWAAWSCSGSWQVWPYPRGSDAR